jgi:hypothetical protein
MKFKDCSHRNQTARSIKRGYTSSLGLATMPDYVRTRGNKRFLMEGAREYTLPAVYIAALENIEAVREANHGWDRRKRALVVRRRS